MDQGTLQTVANFLSLLVVGIAVAWADQRSKKRDKTTNANNLHSNEIIKNNIVSEVTSQSQTLADKLDQVNNRLITVLNDRVNELALRLGAVEQDNRTLTQTIANYKELTDVQADKLTESTKYTASLEKIINDARHELDKVVKSYELLIAEQGKSLESKDIQLANKDVEIASLTSQVTGLIARLDAEAEVVKTLTQRVVTLEKKVASLESQLQSKDIELKATLLNTAELESKLTLVTAERDAAYKERDDITFRMQAEIDRLSDALAELTAKFDMLSSNTHTEPS